MVAGRSVGRSPLAAPLRQGHQPGSGSPRILTPRGARKQMNEEQYVRDTENAFCMRFPGCQRFETWGEPAELTDDQAAFRLVFAAAWGALGLEDMRKLLLGGVSPNEVAAVVKVVRGMESPVETALCVCCRTNFAESASSMAELLLSAGADPNVPSSEEGRLRAPLHYAVGHGNWQMVMLLLDAGADVEQRDADGNTAMNISPPDAAQQVIIHDLLTAKLKEANNARLVDQRRRREKALQFKKERFATSRDDFHDRLHQAVSDVLEEPLTFGKDVPATIDAAIAARTYPIPVTELQEALRKSMGAAFDEFIGGSGVGDEQALPPLVDLLRGYPGDYEVVEDPVGSTPQVYLQQQWTIRSIERYVEQCGGVSTLAAVARFLPSKFSAFSFAKRYGSSLRGFILTEPNVFRVTDEPGGGKVVVELIHLKATIEIRQKAEEEASYAREFIEIVEITSSALKERDNKIPIQEVGSYYLAQTGTPFSKSVVGSRHGRSLRQFLDSSEVEHLFSTYDEDDGGRVVPMCRTKAQSRWGSIRSAVIAPDEPNAVNWKETKLALNKQLKLKRAEDAKRADYEARLDAQRRVALKAQAQRETERYQREQGDREMKKALALGVEINVRMAAHNDKVKADARTAILKQEEEVRANEAESDKRSEDKRAMDLAKKVTEELTEQLQMEGMLGHMHTMIMRTRVFESDPGLVKESELWSRLLADLGTPFLNLLKSSGHGTLRGYLEHRNAYNLARGRTMMYCFEKKALPDNLRTSEDLAAGPGGAGAAAAQPSYLSESSARMAKDQGSAAMVSFVKEDNTSHRDFVLQEARSAALNEVYVGLCKPFARHSMTTLPLQEGALPTSLVLEMCPSAPALMKTERFGAGVSGADEEEAYVIALSDWERRKEAGEFAGAGGGGEEAEAAAKPKLLFQSKYRHSLKKFMERRDSPFRFDASNEAETGHDPVVMMTSGLIKIDAIRAETKRLTQIRQEAAIFNAVLRQVLVGQAVNHLIAAAMRRKAESHLLALHAFHTDHLIDTRDPVWVQRYDRLLTTKMDELELNMPVFTFKEVSDILEEECGDPFGRLKASSLGLRQYMTANSTMAAALGYGSPGGALAADDPGAFAGEEESPVLFELTTAPDGKMYKPRRGTRRFRWYNSGALEFGDGEDDDDDDEDGDGYLGGSRPGTAGTDGTNSRPNSGGGEGGELTGDVPLGDNGEEKGGSDKKDADAAGGDAPEQTPDPAAGADGDKGVDGGVEDDNAEKGNEKDGAADGAGGAGGGRDSKMKTFIIDNNGGSNSGGGPSSSSNNNSAAVTQHETQDTTMTAADLSMATTDGDGRDSPLNSGADIVGRGESDLLEQSSPVFEGPLDGNPGVRLTHFIARALEPQSDRPQLEGCLTIQQLQLKAEAVLGRSYSSFHLLVDEYGDFDSYLERDPAFDFWDENEANLESGSPTPDEMGGGSSEGSEADGNLVTLVYLTEGLDIRLASLQIKEEDSAWREMEQELIDIIIPKLNEPEVDGRLRIATLGEFVATQKAAFANLPLAKHHSSLRVFLEARDDHFACVGDFAMTIERSKREENMLEEKKNFQERKWNDATKARKDKWDADKTRLAEEKEAKRRLDEQRKTSLGKLQLIFQQKELEDKKAIKAEKKAKARKAELKKERKIRDKELITGIPRGQHL